MTGDRYHRWSRSGRSGPVPVPAPRYEYLLACLLEVLIRGVYMYGTSQEVHGRYT